jgi:hypothetical protein
VAEYQVRRPTRQRDGAQSVHPFLAHAGRRIRRTIGSAMQPRPCSVSACPPNLVLGDPGRQECLAVHDRRERRCAVWLHSPMVARRAFCLRWRLENVHKSGW